MLTEYEVATTTLVWSPETSDKFNLIKKAMNECHTLFDIDEMAPVFLHTDASDYGIGGHVFQIVVGVEQPIAFMSKSPTGTECRWSTIENECRAIVFSLRKE